VELQKGVLLVREKVAIYKQKILRYSKNPPYFPPSIFPEYPFKDEKIEKGNEVYSSLRQLLNLLNLDSHNFNTKAWNPFSSFISPGHTVLLKPNFVRHFNDSGPVECLITHGSLIRAVLDYVYIALKGKGRIIIADGPIDEGDFEKITEIAGLEKVKEFYKDKAGFNIEIYDLRRERVIKKDNKIIERTRLKGDPNGYTVINLGNDSAFKRNPLNYRTFKGSECIDEIMFSHHNKEKDEYLIANTFLQADIVINMPKMKTHRKAGVTLSLKNMVGVTGDRNWLPHFSGGSSGNNQTGFKEDKVARVKAMCNFLNIYIGPFVKCAKRNLRYLIGLTESDIDGGDWYGNDIMWRTIVDLARIARYTDHKGIIRQDRQRKCFIITDGIIAGECDGPISPLPKPCGVLVAGFDEFYVDIVTARLMGFDPLKIPKFKNILDGNSQWLLNARIENIECASNIKAWHKNLSDFRGRCLGFKPYYGWKGKIEVK
jgi:uncharacterized protein (DUF362 family)